MDHFTRNSLLNPAQFGFVIDQSTSQNLFRDWGSVFLVEYTRVQTKLVFIDHAKVFDVVYIEKILLKL